jgi:hypothetical protein
MEMHLLYEIFRHFLLPRSWAFWLPDAVKVADNIALRWEARDLCHPDMVKYIEPLPVGKYDKLYARSPSMVYMEFSFKLQHLVTDYAISRGVQ